MKIEKLKRREFSTMIKDRRWAWTPYGVVGVAIAYAALLFGLPLIFLTEDHPRDRIDEIATGGAECLKLAFHWVED